MTREEAITRLKNMAWLYGSTEREQNIEAIDMAIEALSQPIVAKCYEIDKDRIYCSPEVADKVFKALHEDTNVQNMHNGDLISREDAIELLTKIVFDEPPYLDSETLCRIYAEEQINTLPSAAAVHGEWIKTTSGNGWNEWYVLKCPFCDATIEDKLNRKWEYNYCPNCGARMKGGDDE